MEERATMDWLLVIQMTCQWLVVASFVGAFFTSVYEAFNGSPETKPKGYDGFLNACVYLAITAGIVWGSGAFNVLFGR